MQRHGLSSKTHYFLSSLMLVLPVLSNAEGPTIHSQSFHMGYGLASDPITPRDYINDIWNLRAALKETNLPGKMVREAENHLKEASDQLVPLWRQSQENPADAVDVDAKAAAIWATLETDLRRILGPLPLEQFRERLIILFLQELIVPCPDAVWGPDDFMHLNMTERQKEEIDKAFSELDQRCDKAREDFRSAIAKDASQISLDRVEKLRLLLADRRHQVRSRLTAEQLDKWDSYILSEAKKSAAEEAQRAAGKPRAD